MRAMMKIFTFVRIINVESMASGLHLTSGSLGWQRPWPSHLSSRTCHTDVPLHWQTGLSSPVECENLHVGDQAVAPWWFGAQHSAQHTVGAQEMLPLRTHQLCYCRCFLSTALS